MKIKKHWLTAIVLLSLTFSLSSQGSYIHRGYLGWLIDFSRTGTNDEWPSIRIDSALIGDYTDAIDFLQRDGFNEITLWGLFTNKFWEPEVDKTIDAQRKALVNDIIFKAHQRNLKVLCGIGIYSWGFEKIISHDPSVKCNCNPEVMDYFQPGSWEWQQKVLDWVMDNFAFDGMSLQSADRGRCKCGTSSQYSDMQYHALLVQRTVQYIRMKKRDYLIGISGWGMDFRNPGDMMAVKKMTENVDYLIDVGETALLAGGDYRRKLIESIAPCKYGNTAIPNIEPIQALKRNLYFVPTVYSTGQKLKALYKDGGLACEAYARTRGNPGDELTGEVIGRILKDPSADLTIVLKDAIDFIYRPVDSLTTSKLAAIFKESEEAFFASIPVDGFDRNIILLMPREQQKPESTYLKIMQPSARDSYKNTMKKIHSQLLDLKQGTGNPEKTEMLIQCVANVINEINQL
jgi:hypothetical protein